MNLNKIKRLIKKYANILPPAYDAEMPVIPKNTFTKDKADLLESTSKLHSLQRDFVDLSHARNVLRSKIQDEDVRSQLKSVLENLISISNLLKNKFKHEKDLFVQSFSSSFLKEDETKDLTKDEQAEKFISIIEKSIPFLRDELEMLSKTQSQTNEMETVRPTR